jgi:hypothetical protein
MPSQKEVNGNVDTYPRASDDAAVLPESWVRTDDKVSAFGVFDGEPGSKCGYVSFLC